MSDEPEKTFTLQETFDMAVGGVIRQGGPSVRPSPTPQHGFGCAYHGDNDRKCAVGQCIVDDKYDLSMEGASINSLRQLQRQPIKGHDLDMLYELRFEHDFAAIAADGRVRTDAEFLPLFRAACAKLADARGLSKVVLQ